MIDIIPNFVVVGEVARSCKALKRLSAKFSSCRGSAAQDTLNATFSLQQSASANSQLWHFLKKRSRCTRSQVGFPIGSTSSIGKS